MSYDSQPKYLLDTPRRYRILVSGTLDASWSDRLGGMTVSNTQLPDGTAAMTLSGALADQSALIGVLNTLHDCGLALVSVERLANETTG